MAEKYNISYIHLLLTVVHSGSLKRIPAIKRSPEYSN